MAQQASAPPNQQITQNDIYAIMDKIEAAKTDAEREALDGELQQALVLLDEKHRQPLPTSSEKVFLFKHKHKSRSLLTFKPNL